MDKANGTSFQGTVTTTYNNLIDLFGQPRKGSIDKKTNCSWVLEFTDGTVATIYDWKMPEIPMEAYKWHIGGKTKKAVEKVSDICGNLNVTYSIL